MRRSLSQNQINLPSQDLVTIWSTSISAEMFLNKLNPRIKKWWTIVDGI
jgi:hypothetical protein